MIEYIQSQKGKIRIVSDMAFDAVDVDESNSLDKEELTKIIMDVAVDLKVKMPTE
jgi:hypothetical protein